MDCGGKGCEICVNPHDIHAIAKAVNYLLDNPEWIHRIDENGRTAVKKRNNWATLRQEQFGLYNSLPK